MIELHKVSSATKNKRIHVASCPFKGKPVTLLNNHRIDELYDLTSEISQTKKPLFLSNQFIHCYTSYIFRDESRNWSDIFVVSDFDRNKCIWRVPIEEVRSLFLLASEDYPHSVSRFFDPTKQDYITVTNQCLTRRCSQPLAASQLGLRGPTTSRRSPDKLGCPIGVAELDVRPSLRRMNPDCPHPTLSLWLLSE